MNKKLEDRIAAESAAGREALQVWQDTIRKMSGEQRLEKALELTATARQIMRAGLKNQFPFATEDELQEKYIDRLLSYHGLSLAEVRRLQVQEANRS